MHVVLSAKYSAMTSALALAAVQVLVVGLAAAPPSLFARRPHFTRNAILVIVFTSIVTTVRLGRRIYDNLRKAMAYILAVHVPIAGLALIPLLFGLPLMFWPRLIVVSARSSRWPRPPSSLSCHVRRAWSAAPAR